MFGIKEKVKEKKSKQALGQPLTDSQTIYNQLLIPMINGYNILKIND